MSIELHGLDGLRHKLKTFLQLQRQAFNPGTYQETTYELEPRTPSVAPKLEIEHRRISELPEKPVIPELPDNDLNPSWTMSELLAEPVIPELPDNTMSEFAADIEFYRSWSTCVTLNPIFELPCSSTTGSCFAEDYAVFDVDVLVPVNLDGDAMVVSNQISPTDFFQSSNISTLHQGVSVSPLFRSFPAYVNGFVDASPNTSTSNTGFHEFVMAELLGENPYHLSNSSRVRLNTHDRSMAENIDVFGNATERDTHSAAELHNDTKLPESFKDAVLNLGESDLNNWLSGFISDIDSIMRSKMLTYSFKEAVSELSGTDRDKWLLDFISQIEHITSTRPQQQYYFEEPHMSVMDHMMMPMAEDLEHECDTSGNSDLNLAPRSSTPSIQSGALRSPSLQSFASSTSSAYDPLVNIVKAATQVLQRSLSSNDSADTSNSPGNSQLDDVPQRSYSAPFGYVKIRTQIVTSNNSVPALNGVSQYYSSKTTRVIFDPDNEGLIQLTNSQKIRRTASYSSHNTATERVSVHPCHSGRLTRVQSLYESFREVPFPELVRPSSLKDPTSSGVNIAHDMRSCQRKGTKGRHRFRHGRVCSSGRGSLMRRAYPNMQCDKCGAVFEGSDRRLQLAKHRRKVHAKRQPLAIIAYHEPVHCCG